MKAAKAKLVSGGLVIYNLIKEVKNMSPKIFSLVTGIIFSVIALLHILRIVLGWSANIGGWLVPIWISVVAIIVAAYLAYSALKLAKK